jgi:hypothetical protein
VQLELRPLERQGLQGLPLEPQEPKLLVPQVQGLLELQVPRPQVLGR